MRNKIITHKDVVAGLDRKWPGFKKRVAEGVAQLRIAERIQELRQRAHLSQKRLAEKIGTTQSNVARMENLDYRDYRVSTLAKIAEATRGRFVIP
jgi:ribosome-binding protein aMBF1 (putative translation factor)